MSEYFDEENEDVQTRKYGIRKGRLATCERCSWTYHLNEMILTSDGVKLCPKCMQEYEPLPYNKG